MRIATRKEYIVSFYYLLQYRLQPSWHQALGRLKYSLHLFMFFYILCILLRPYILFEKCQISICSQRLS
jgi:hypothetical protein